jgi:hypothetical protein
MQPLLQLQAACGHGAMGKHNLCKAEPHHKATVTHTTHVTAAPKPESYAKQCLTTRVLGSSEQGLTLQV